MLLRDKIPNTLSVNVLINAWKKPHGSQTLDFVTYIGCIIGQNTVIVCLLCHSDL